MFNLLRNGLEKNKSMLLLLRASLSVWYSKPCNLYRMSELYRPSLQQIANFRIMKISQKLGQLADYVNSFKMRCLVWIDTRHLHKLSRYLLSVGQSPSICFMNAPIEKLRQYPKSFIFYFPFMIDGVSEGDGGFFQHDIRLTKASQEKCTKE